MFKRYLYLNYRSFAGFNFWFKRRVTPTGWIVLAAALASAALGVDTNASFAYQTFTFLFCLILASALFARFHRKKKLQIERILPKFGSAEEPLRYSLVLHNRTKKIQKALQLREEFADPRPTFEQFASTPEPGEEKRNWLDRTYSYYRWKWLLARNTRAEAPEQALPDLPANSTQTLRAELLPARRGVLRFAGFSLVTTDPFGLFRSLQKIAASQSVLILPKRYSLPPFELPGSMKYQQGGVSMASSIGESEEFVSLREYRSGDPLRRIHWKSFAKTGKPIVKEFQDEFFVRHALVLDTFSAAGHYEIFEEAVSVAASLAYTVQDQDSLLDLMFVGPQAFCFTSGRGVGHTEQMLEILASVQLCRDKNVDTLKHLVLEHVAQISGCLCVFLEWDDERKNFVRALKAQNIPVLVFVVAPRDVTIEPGPMADDPAQFHVLPLGKIGERLASL